MSQQSPVVYGLLSKAFTLHQKGLYVEAEPLYKAVLKIDPRQSDALHLLGVLSSDCGDDESAILYIRRALVVNPGFAAAHVNLGLALRRLARYEEALASYDQAIRSDPALIEAHFNRGNVLRDMGRTSEAFDCFLQVIKIQPQNADALNNCGSILWASEKYQESIGYFDQALSIDPVFVDALVNKGSSLEKLGNVDDAIRVYERALEINPQHTVARVNLGSIIEDRGCPIEALGHYLLAQKHAPGVADGHWNEALCRLKVGEYEIGWEKYEWRWKGVQNGWARNFKQSQWQGETLIGKTILLHAEQGFGDTLQFFRYVALVTALGGRVILEVQSSLVNLLASLDGDFQVVARGKDLPEFDVHCPLLSLPWVMKTSLDTIPSKVPYVFADCDDASRWGEMLVQSGVARGEKCIGLVWDTTTKNNSKRRVPLALLLESLGESAVICVLQKDVNEEDKLLIKRSPNVIYFEGLLSDFSDTAALVSLMDVVISIDTAVTHLAGAMAKPVMVMLPAPSEWRWLLYRSDSPWYPTARLFRQVVPGDWTSVVQGVSDAVQKLNATSKHLCM